MAMRGTGVRTNAQELGFDVLPSLVPLRANRKLPIPRAAYQQHLALGAEAEQFAS